MSWFCETCDHVFETDEAKTRQCRACHAEDWNRALAIRLSYVEDLADELERELDTMTESRDAWRTTAKMHAKRARELANK